MEHYARLRMKSVKRFLNETTITIISLTENYVGEVEKCISSESYHTSTSGNYNYEDCYQPNYENPCIINESFLNKTIGRIIYIERAMASHQSSNYAEDNRMSTIKDFGDFFIFKGIMIPINECLYGERYYQEQFLIDPIYY